MNLPGASLCQVMGIFSQAFVLPVPSHCADCHALYIDSCFIFVPHWYPTDPFLMQINDTMRHNLRNSIVDYLLYYVEHAVDTIDASRQMESKRKLFTPLQLI